MDVTWCQQHHLGGFRCVWKEKFGGAGISNGERIWIRVTGSSLCHWALVCKLSFCLLSRKAERLQEAHTCARWEKRHVHCEFGGWHKNSKRPPIGSRVVPLIQNDFWSKVVWSATHSPRHCITKMSIYQQDSQATSKLLEALGTSFRKQRSVMQIYLCWGSAWRACTDEQNIHHPSESIRSDSGFMFLKTYSLEWRDSRNKTCS